MTTIKVNFNTFNPVFPIKLIDGIEELKQRITILFASERSDYFHDLTKGLDFEILVGERISREAHIKATLEKFHHVIKVEKLVSKFSEIDRTLNINFTLQTDFGKLEIDVGKLLSFGGVAVTFHGNQILV